MSKTDWCEPCAASQVLNVYPPLIDENNLVYCPYCKKPTKQYAWAPDGYTSSPSPHLIKIKSNP